PWNSFAISAVNPGAPATRSNTGSLPGSLGNSSPPFEDERPLGSAGNYFFPPSNGGGRGFNSSYPRWPSARIGPGPKPRWSRSTLFSLHEYSWISSSGFPSTQ